MARHHRIRAGQSRAETYRYPSPRVSGIGKMTAIGACARRTGRPSGRPFDSISPSAQAALRQTLTRSLANITRPTMSLTLNKTDAIRDLNDAFRRSFIGGVVLI